MAKINSNKQMKNLLLLLSSFAFFIAAKAQPSPKKVVADKIIAVVGSKIILKSDIDNRIADMNNQKVELPPNAQCLLLDQELISRALVLQAEKDSLPVTDEEVETEIDNRVRYFVSQYGSKEELEKIAGKTVYQLREDFKESIRDQKLAQAMRAKVVGDVRITPNEVNKYFEKIPVDSLPLYETELEISQIISYPKASREAEEYVVEQLKEFKAQIESGKKDFKTLASIYSDDPGSKDKGGEYEVNRTSKEMDATWLGKAFNLKEGQISTPFKTQFGYHIIQLVSRAGDDAVVRHILLIPKVSSVEVKAAVDKMDSVRAKLIAGTLAFGAAVDRYSDDPASKFNAGRITNREGGGSLTLDQLSDKDLVLMMKTLRVGEYSQPTPYTDERGKQGVRIINLVSKTEPHRENLKDDYDKIAQRALEDKKNEVLEAWFMKKIPTYYVKIAPEYNNCDDLKKWTANGTVGKN